VSIISLKWNLVEVGTWNYYSRTELGRVVGTLNGESFFLYKIDSETRRDG
jgi:hypothetical protein